MPVAFSQWLIVWILICRKSTGNPKTLANAVRRCCLRRDYIPSRPAAVQGRGGRQMPTGQQEGARGGARKQQHILPRRRPFTGGQDLVHSVSGHGCYIRLRYFPSHLSYRYESFNFRPTGRLTFDQRAHSSRAVQTPNGALAVCGTVHFDTAHRVQRPRLYAVCPCTCACTSPRVSRSVRRTPARGVAAPASPRSERRLRCNETCKRCTVYAAASSIVLLAFLRCSRRSLPL